MTDGSRLDYRATGVDLDAAERAKEGLKELVASTRDANTLSELGAFGGLYAVPADVKNPVLVSSADGVGTKLKVAFMADRHDTVGQDLVNHCVNDILVQGAEPLFFLDYLATGVLEEDVVQDVVRGVALACRANGCALLGGETAQMPDFYQPGEYDLAGFIVGSVPREGILDGSTIRPGDVLVGMASSGLHTNGYTLARKIVFDVMGLGIDDPFPEEGATAGEVLLRVHRTYLPEIRGLLGPRGDVGPEEPLIHGLAHITGGGIPGNLPRILPPDTGAFIDTSRWEIPNLFRVLEERGGVAREEMFRVFNMGVGMIAVVRAGESDEVVQHLVDHGVDAWVMGAVESGEGVRFA